MKRFFLAVGILAAAYTVNAQQPVIYASSGDRVDYSYQVPPTIRTNFQVTYPMATKVTWMPMNDWWYASYVNNDNSITRVYYNTQPYYLERNESYRVALPVLNTHVPDNVIEEAIRKFGADVFSITAGKLTETGQSYFVTVIRNGVSEIVSLNGDTMAMADIDK